MKKNSAVSGLDFSLLLMTVLMRKILKFFGEAKWKAFSLVLANKELLGGEVETVAIAWLHAFVGSDHQRYEIFIFIQYHPRHLLPFLYGLQLLEFVVFVRIHLKLARLLWLMSLF